MKTMYEALDELENIGSHIEKEEALINIVQSYRNAENFFRLAFNDTVYGIAEKTMYAAYADIALKDGSHNYQHVSDWLNTINKTEGSGKELIKIPTFMVFCTAVKNMSGDQQIMYIRKFFDFLEPIKKKWFSRALLHDLRCGVQVKTINKVFKRLGLEKIEKFAMQLAKKLDCYNEEEVAKKVKFPCSMEMKYDGYRIQAEIWPETNNDPDSEDAGITIMHCRLVSRRGNDKTDAYPEVVEELKYLFDGQHVILDGEMVADSFQKLTRKDDKSVRKYVVFDILLDEKLPYRNRWDNLVSLADDVGITAYNDKQLINNKENLNSSAKYIFLAEHYSCNNITEMQEFFDDANIRKEEGIIVKLDDKPYKRGSRNNMFKCKKVYTADLLIVGFKYGEGKRSGKVATLELMDATESIKVDVGSGIKDDMCDLLTQQVEDTITSGLPESHIPFMHSICEILYNEVTETGSLRFPRFVKIRDDKTEPDAIGDL